MVGIRNVADLLKDRNVFLSLHELKHCFNVKANLLTLLGLQSSLQSLREKCKDNQCAGVCESFLEKFSKTKKANKVVYKKLVSMKQLWPTQSQEKWIADCKLQGDDLIDWTAVYLSPFKCTKVTKLIIFQFFHRWLATNSFLKKIGIKESHLCTFCKSEAESLIHLFWYCRVISQFGQGFRQWMIINHEFVENELTPEMVLGLKPSLFNKKSSCLALITRYFIWICKTQEKPLEIGNFKSFASTFVFASFECVPCLCKFS